MPTQVFSTAISAAGTDAVFDFGSEVYSKGYLTRGTMTTAAQFNVYGSTDGVAYYKLFHPQAATSTTTPLSFLVSSFITDCMVQIPIPTRYMKFTASAAAANASSMTVVAHKGC